MYSDQYERFLKLLDSRGLTVADVCKATGIAQSNMSSWKTRGGGIGLKSLAKIADFFDVPVDYFREDEYTLKNLIDTYVRENEYTSDEQKLIEAFRSADDLTQQMVLRVLKLDKD